VVLRKVEEGPLLCSRGEVAASSWTFVTSAYAAFTWSTDWLDLLLQLGQMQLLYVAGAKSELCQSH